MSFCSTETKIVSSSLNLYILMKPFGRECEFFLVFVKFKNNIYKIFFSFFSYIYCCLQEFVWIIYCKGYLWVIIAFLIAYPFLWNFLFFPPEKLIRFVYLQQFLFFFFFLFLQKINSIFILQDSSHFMWKKCKKKKEFFLQFVLVLYLKKSFFLLKF